MLPLLACLTTGTLVLVVVESDLTAGLTLAEEGLPPASEGGLLPVGDMSSSIVALSRAMLASISGEVLCRSAGLIEGEETSGGCPYGLRLLVKRTNSLVSSIDCDAFFSM